MTFFPFESLENSSRELGLVVATLIGFGFGFVLERAGFGRATKLAAQFYFRDLTVFKVMFSAIVTAMLGLVIISGLGLAELQAISEGIASWTYIWPMLVGGFVLGVGFIISGYCPGTSIVAGASGNIDGLFTVAGVISGTFIYSELLQIPRFAAFHTSGDKGALFLYQLLGVRPQVLAVAVALMAVGMFVGADKIEGRRLPRRFAFATFAAASAIALLTILLPAPTVEASAPKTITVEQLAKATVEKPWTVQMDLPRVRVDGEPFLLVGGADAWNAYLAKHAGAAPAAISSAPKKGTFQKPKKKGGGCSA